MEAADGDSERPGQKNEITGDVRGVVQAHKIVGGVNVSCSMSGIFVQKYSEMHAEVLLQKDGTIAIYEQQISLFRTHVQSLVEQLNYIRERLRWTEEQLAAAIAMLTDHQQTAGQEPSSARLESSTERKTWHIDEWEEKFDIQANGDTRLRLDYVGVTQEDALESIEIFCGCAWDQPETDRVRAHVQGGNVAIRGQSVELANMLGHNLRTTWTPGGRMRIELNFHEPVSRDTEFHHTVHVYWPGMCRPLIDEGADVFAVRFNDPVARLRQEILFPDNFQVNCRSFGFDGGAQHFKVTQDSNVEGRSSVLVRARRLTGGRRMGIHATCD